jgi:hypothetical protein
MMRRYSDTLAVTLLKVHRPDKYREKQPPNCDVNVNLQKNAENAKIAVVAQLNSIQERLFGRALGLPDGGRDDDDIERIPARADGEPAD